MKLNDVTCDCHLADFLLFLGSLTKSERSLLKILAETSSDHSEKDEIIVSLFDDDLFKNVNELHKTADSLFERTYFCSDRTSSYRYRLFDLLSVKDFTISFSFSRSLKNEIKFLRQINLSDPVVQCVMGFKSLPALRLHEWLINTPFQEESIISLDNLINILLVKPKNFTFKDKSCEFLDSLIADINANSMVKFKVSYQLDGEPSSVDQNVNIRFIKTEK